MRLFLAMDNVKEAEDKHYKIWNKLDEKKLLSVIDAYIYVDADTQIYIVVEEKEKNFMMDVNFVKELFNL